MRILDELGYYLLAGAGGEGPAALTDEARRGEELGFGTAFISERWNVKEAASLTGAACAVTTRMQIATAATNHNTRHPLISGSWATTMHRLSGGRFTLGIGRGIGAIYSAYGIPAVTTAQMEDFAQVMRRLWRGEVIFNHDGPIGKYQILVLDPDFREDIRLALVAFGPNTLRLGGRVFDDVILHTYFTPETVARCVRTVKDAAEQAGGRARSRFERRQRARLRTGLVDAMGKHHQKLRGQQHTNTRKVIAHREPQSASPNRRQRGAGRQQVLQGSAPQPATAAQGAAEIARHPAREAQAIVFWRHAQHVDESKRGTGNKNENRAVGQRCG
jgi:alkanesulfonate monooxygenase SsuD/methylene tetrahydromethanopterin reductase-like flavin-dependent oxidoreductase (luciferase family)